MPRPPKSPRTDGKKSGAPADPAASELSATALSAFVAADPLSLRLLDAARRLANTGSIVLIHGESGTGKDLLASLLHYLGPSPQEQLVKIDCASLPHDLLESELFGFERGAFTGANQMKRGRFELAGNGTLVLDEIASLSLAMQAKLLRVIEDRTFDRLGGTKPIRVSARIIALTNIDLAAAVAARAFREDLFFRLNVVPLEVPPLRERPADIRALATHLLAQLSETHNRPQLRLSTDALSALYAYSFPGNVRELRNILERAIVGLPVSTSVGYSDITLDDLPRNVRTATAGPRSKLTLEQLERDYIAEILDYTRGKKSKAADILGITRKTLLEKRKKYGL
jgi:transcriptional regulator with PAS, ATPase and Fis domain